MNSTAMKQYKSLDWKFRLDIPKGWHALPPVSTNSPNEMIRFASNEGGTHLLIIFRELHDPKQSLHDVSDQMEQVLMRHGFGNFVRGHTTMGSKIVQTLDFDRPKDGGTWSCRHYIVVDGNLRHTLGFGTTDRVKMFELYERIAESFQITAEEV